MLKWKAIEAKEVINVLSGPGSPSNFMNISFVQSGDMMMIGSNSTGD